MSRSEAMPGLGARAQTSANSSTRWTNASICCDIFETSANVSHDTSVTNIIGAGLSASLDTSVSFDQHQRQLRHCLRSAP